MIVKMDTLTKIESNTYSMAPYIKDSLTGGGNSNFKKQFYWEYISDWFTFSTVSRVQLLIEIFKTSIPFTPATCLSSGTQNPKQTLKINNPSS